MSYSDLLSSHPASTQSLSSLTTGAGMGGEVPRHLPGVEGVLNGVGMGEGYGQGMGGREGMGGEGMGQGQGSAAPSLRGFSMYAPGPVSPVSLSPSGPAGTRRDAYTNTQTNKERDRESVALLDLHHVGGEWERQGLGRGLEERLEALVIPSLGVGVASSSSSSSSLRRLLAPLSPPPSPPPPPRRRRDHLHLHPVNDLIMNVLPGSPPPPQLWSAHRPRPGPRLRCWTGPGCWTGPDPARHHQRPTTNERGTHAHASSLGAGIGSTLLS
ncbi:hypothetical protein GALMADRAFT_137404 [Galerina marginata CBS 339.88]|uniref:Uncharacterized protein n=1 Tax=Galerina marginata (strain CBS 339.88) TaxID=685588 RepID=A0A067TKV4_GALM3|nr:hypothetical protein GALMADRAFT_137404 [Galerina marginata CBS 339.88]